MAVLKTNFKDITKALKPALAELVSRTEKSLQDDANYHLGEDYDAIMREMGMVWEDKKDFLARETILKLEMKQREFAGAKAVLENQYRVSQPVSTSFILPSKTAN